MHYFKDRRGQMLLIVVLTMIIALTVGLSIVSRTIVDLRISRQNEESERAFQAAEAGVEQALQSSDSTINGKFANDATYETTVTSQEGTDFLLNGGDVVDQDVGIDLWLSEYPDYASPRSGTLTVYWSAASQTECDPGNENATISALEIVILTGTPGSPNPPIKYVYDDCAARIPEASDPPNSSNTFDGITFKYAVQLPAINSGLIAKIIPIYNSTQVAVRFDPADLPLQGQVIESIGKSGETVRRIQYFSSHPQVPLEIFPYSIVAQNND